jgi:hypothetical protein
VEAASAQIGAAVDLAVFKGVLADASERVGDTRTDEADGGGRRSSPGLTRAT